MWPSSALRAPRRRPSDAAVLRRARIQRGPDVRRGRVRVGDRTNPGWREFRREIDRSRRYERPFTMVAIPIDPAVEDVQTLPALVADGVRSVDVVWQDSLNLYVVMPETRRERALAVIGRLTRRIPNLRSRTVRAAMFPDDASTAGALLEVLNGSEGDAAVPAENLASDLMAGSALTRSLP